MKHRSLLESVSQQWPGLQDGSGDLHRAGWREQGCWGEWERERERDVTAEAQQMRAVERGGGRMKREKRGHILYQSSYVLSPEDRRCRLLTQGAKGRRRRSRSDFYLLYTPHSSPLLPSSSLSSSSQPVWSHRGLSAWHRRGRRSESWQNN